MYEHFEEMRLRPEGGENDCVCVCVRTHTICPRFMDGSFLMKLLGQMLQPLQTSDFAEDPLLVALLCSFQGVPRPVDILKPISTKISAINPF